MDVIEIIPPGICPQCGKNMMLLRADYSAYKVSPSGYLEARVDEKSELTLVCPSCGFSTKAHMSVNGVLPDGFDDRLLREPITNNPIGSKQ